MNLESFWSPNYLLSFGGPRNDVLMAMTNEHPTTPNKILLFYLKNIDTSSTNVPTGSNSLNYWIGNAGLYFVKGLINDPVNSFLAYLFVTDKNVTLGTFGVFKMNFTASPYKHIYTALTMSSGSGFSVNTFARTSLIDANDFFFAGKAQSLTDGTTTKTFPTGIGYVMKAKTSDST